MKYIGSSRSVDKVRTTIGVKMATKYLILDHSKPGESLEDTIVRTIIMNDQLVAENKRMNDLLIEHNVMGSNLLVQYIFKRRKESIEPYEGSMIHFSYAQPPEDPILMKEYEMDIMVERTIENGKEISFDELDLEISDRIKLHFMMVEKVINLHFDKGFKMHKKAFLIDPNYWKRTYGRVGLPESSYLKDILSYIDEFERG
jgi:hypothetical protein